MKKSNQKGFTLSEMLIVILIIAVLVGISAIATNCAFKYTDFEKASLCLFIITANISKKYQEIGILIRYFKTLNKKESNNLFILFQISCTKIQ